MIARPVKDRVLVDLVEKEENGLVEANNDFQEGTIVAIGKTLDAVYNLEFKVGDTILLDGRAKGKAVESNGRTVYMFPIHQIEIVLDK